MKCSNRRIFFLMVALIGILNICACSDAKSTNTSEYKTMMIKSVEVDSEYGLGYAKEKVFDGGVSPDGITAWASYDSPMPHFFIVNLESPTRLDLMYIKNRVQTQIDSLEVQIKNDDDWKTVFDKSGLKEQGSIRIDFPDEMLKSIKIIIKSGYMGNEVRNVADIEELEFPGYKPILMSLDKQ